MTRSFHATTDAGASPKAHRRQTGRPGGPDRRDARLARNMEARRAKLDERTYGGANVVPSCDDGSRRTSIQTAGVAFLGNGMSYLVAMAVEAIGHQAVTVTVRAMGQGDLSFAAELHERSLPHGLFPALGRRFLMRYLETYVRSANGVALIAEWAGAPAGFLVGVLDEPAHYREVVRRRGARLAAAGLAALASRPRVALWFWRTRAFRYVIGLRRLAKGRATEGIERRSGRPGAVLSHVAVLPELRGSGVGSELVESFSAAARAANVSGIRLTTRSGIEGAARFYLRLGWRRVDGFVDADGLSWERLRFDLT